MRPSSLCSFLRNTVLLSTFSTGATSSSFSHPFFRISSASIPSFSNRIPYKSLPSIPLIGSFFSTTTESKMGIFGGSSGAGDGGASSSYEVQKSKSEWQAVLSPEQFRVIREKGTEAPYTGKYDKHAPKEGVYTCAACSAPLYTATHKFKSGCGWPAYFDSIPGAVERHTDGSHFMERTEIVCAKCGGHLGHVFKGEGYPTPTDERHCVNSVSLRFVDDEAKAKAKVEK